MNLIQLEDFLYKNNLQPNFVFQHKKSGKKYVIEKIKGIKENDVWSYKVVYKSLEIFYINEFERELTDFHKSFLFVK